VPTIITGDVSIQPLWQATGSTAVTLRTSASLSVVSAIKKTDPKTGWPTTGSHPVFDLMGRRASKRGSASERAAEESRL